MNFPSEISMQSLQCVGLTTDLPVWGTDDFYDFQFASKVDWTLHFHSLHYILHVNSLYCATISDHAHLIPCIVVSSLVAGCRLFPVQTWDLLLLGLSSSLLSDTGWFFPFWHFLSLFMWCNLGSTWRPPFERSHSPLVFITMTSLHISYFKPLVKAVLRLSENSIFLALLIFTLETSSTLTLLIADPQFWYLCREQLFTSIFG